MATAPAPSERVRHFFDPLVATRGELVALGGAVAIVGGYADRVKAIVRGTLPYDVALTVTGTESSGALVASCTCAHAAHALCKHSWATLRVAERRGLLARAARSRELAIFPALEDRHEPQLRWLVDLVATRKRGYDLQIDVFERTTDASGASTGWRAASWSRHRTERTRSLRSLAQTGRCEVLVERGRVPEPLVVDDGGPFLLVVVVEEGSSADDLAFPSLVAHGELRRGAEVIRLELLTAIAGTGAAFLGPRALEVARDARFSLVARLHAAAVTIEAEGAESFLRDVLSSCRPEAVELPAAFTVERDAPSQARVHVRRPEDPAARRALLADVTFDYGGVRVAWRDRAPVVFEARRRRIIVRDRDAEQRAIAELVSAGFRWPRTMNRGLRLTIASSRLTRAIVGLPGDRFVVEADGVVHRRASRTSLRVRSGIDWLDLEAKIEFDGVLVSAPALLLAAKRGQSLVRLDDGSIGILPDEWLARVARVADLVPAAAQNDVSAIPETEASALRLRFGREQIAMVDAFLGEERAAVSWEGPLAALRHELTKNVEHLPASPPRGFRGELREYQRAGLGWMQWLEAIGFSGCLADDMGLGKTIQVLALLADRHHRGQAKGPSLVVAPRSVVYNWIDEARRFAPGLRLKELRSSTSTSEALQADLLVTTYGTVRRGADRRAALWFDYVILDEAHAIKNAAAATSRAVNLLRSRHRLALTGTPVENHLGDLASLFEFLNPGMLGPSVRKVASGGLDLGADQAAQLGRGLSPFLLRRTKAEVLPQLPPRIDQTIVCTMEPGQRAVYDRAKKHYQTNLLHKIREGGVADVRFQVLEALLRLRQIACHPGLVDHGLQRQRSAKLDALIEHLEPLARQGKKALVFSQFTTLLDIVEHDLGLRGIALARLDGRTHDRKAPVERFQADPSCSVLLVSLKAGGVGLNLTAAEYVFVLDPWWNPAAEAQAVDRAHRIGQARTVMSYRLLCKDTIEERVAELQDRKRALVSSVFTATEGARLASLSLEDVEALLA
jgi:superfamily II DNA or RNA helicase